MTLPSPKFALFFIAASVVITGASGQNHMSQQAAPVRSSERSACTPAKQLKAVQIHGTWRVRFTQAPAGLPADATLRLERHAEFSESVAGSVNRELGPAPERPAPGHAAKAQLAGDLEDGFLTLDESSNGISITGTWNAEVVEGSCGRSIRGTWKDTSPSAPPDAPEVAFTMEKLAGW